MYFRFFTSIIIVALAGVSMFGQDDVDSIEYYLSILKTSEDNLFEKHWIDAFEREISALKKKDDLANWLKYSRERAKLFRSIGDFKQSSEYLDQIFENIWRNPASDLEKKELGWCNMHKAYLLNDILGDFINARRYYSDAFNLFTEIDQVDIVVRSYVIQPLADIYTRIGEYELSIEMQKDLPALFIKGGATRPLINAYNNIARAYFYNGNYTLAEQAIKDGLEVANITRKERALLLSNYADFLQIANRDDQVLHYADMAMRLLQDEVKENANDYSAKNYLLGVYVTQIDYYSSTGNADQLERVSKRALDLARMLYPSKKHRQFGKIYLANARYARNQNDFTAALEWDQKALQAVIGDFDNADLLACPERGQLYAENVIVDALNGKLSALERLYDSTNEKTYLTALLHHLDAYYYADEALRSATISSQSQLTSSNELHAVCERAIEAALKMYNISDDRKYVQKAYTYLTQTKSLLLSEKVYADQLSSSQPDSLPFWQQEIRLRYHWESLKTQEARADSARRAGLTKQIQDVQRDLVNLQQKRARNCLACSSMHTTQIDITKMQQYLLENGQNIVDFFVGDTSVFIFVLDGESLQVIKQAKDTRYNEKIDAFVDELQQAGSFDTFYKTSYEIYKLFYQPVEPYLNAGEIIIIPDDRIGLIPFSALIVPSDKVALSFKGARYLLHDKEIFYLPASHFLFSKKETDQLMTYVGYAPKFGNVSGLADLSESVKSTEDTKGLLGGTTFIGEAASIDAFMNHAPNYRIVHISTHAGVDEEDLDASWIAFAQGSKDHTYLWSRELKNMELNAEMVVLSACKTGFGRIAKGEGLMSLARSFIMGGAESTLNNLWNISHHSSSQITNLFLENIQENMRKPTALAKAKLDYLNDQMVDETSAHPYYWASMVLVGNGEPILLTSADSYTWIIWLLGTALLMLLLIRSIKKG